MYKEKTSPYTRVRSRSMSNFVVPARINRYRVYDPDSGVLLSDTTGVDTPQAEFKQDERMVDVVTPGFSRMSAGGGIINSPMVKDTTLVSGSFGYLYEENATNGVVTLRQTGSPINPAQRLNWFKQPSVSEPVGFASGLRNRAYANANAIAVDLLVDLLEREKTVSMLARDAQRIFQVTYNAMRWRMPRKRSCVKCWIRRHARNLPKEASWYGRTVSDEWLKWRYGYRPLMMSMSQLLETLPFNVPERITGRAHATTSVTGKDTQQLVKPRPVGSSTEIADTEVILNLEIRTGVLAQVSASRAQQLGFGVENLPSVAWELVPLSFVADWFYGVGDFLGAWLSSASVSYLADWTTTTRQIIDTKTLHLPAVANTMIGNDQKKYTYTRNECVSTLVQATLQKSRVPNQGRSFIQPTGLFTEIRNLNHVLDGAALLYTKFANTLTRTRK